jgi:hypothetical protein
MMLKLSHTTKYAALAALLTAGLAGSAAVTLLPQTGHAQDWDGRYYHRDWDDYRYHRDWDDRYRYYHRDWDDRAWFGIGVPGFGVGFYSNPGYYPYYCSRYDYYHGYCD